MVKRKKLYLISFLTNNSESLINKLKINYSDLFLNFDGKISIEKVTYIKLVVN